MSTLDTCRGNASDTSLANYFQALLVELGAPLTDANFIVLTAWSKCEGPAASQGGYNPFNTTLTTKDVLPGNAGFLGNNPQQNNGNPVKNYNGWDAGLTATASAMSNTHYYPSLVSALRSGSGGAAVANAIGPWGTNPACILARVGQYATDPAALCADLSQSVNTNGTNQGGSGATASAGAATPINLPNPIGAAASLISATLNILRDLTSATFWLRVGQILLGVLLITFGLVAIMSETKGGRGVEQAAAAAAAIE